MRKILSVVIYILVVCFITLLYYLFVFKQSQMLIKSKIEREYISEMKMKAILFDNQRILQEIYDKNIEKYDNEKVLQFVNVIKEQGLNTYRLLENLLEWSCSQIGRINFNPDNLIAEEVVTHVILQMVRPAQAKKIVLNYNIVGSIVVKVDSNMLNTILRNLVNNAIKFTQKGGEITINVTQNENEIQFVVSDTEVGMTDETINKLFEVDKKISKPGTNNEAGTGLGLLLCKEFVEKHGGKIWVESELGKGCDFKFTLLRHLK